MGGSQGMTMICREVMVNKCSGTLAIAAYVIELSNSKNDA